MIRSRPGGSRERLAARALERVSAGSRSSSRRGVALEGRPPVEHLVEHRAEREDVGAVVDRLAAHLLRRHVADGAEHGAGRRCSVARSVATCRCRRRALRRAVAPARSRGSSRARRGSRRRSRASGRDGRCPWRARPRGRRRSAIAISTAFAVGSGSAFEALAQRLALEQLGDRVGRSRRCSPKSKIARMFGCESAATRRLRARSARSGFGIAGRRAGSTLIATSRPSRVSRARYTSPMPPAPSGATIS